MRAKWGLRLHPEPPSHARVRTTFVSKGKLLKLVVVVVVVAVVVVAVAVVLVLVLVVQNVVAGVVIGSSSSSSSSGGFGRLVPFVALVPGIVWNIHMLHHYRTSPAS